MNTGIRSKLVSLLSIIEEHVSELASHLGIKTFIWLWSTPIGVYRPIVDKLLWEITLPRISRQPILKDIVLIAMSGYGQESDRHRSREAGFDQHLTKPVRFEKIQEILATLKVKTT